MKTSRHVLLCLAMLMMSIGAFAGKKNADAVPTASVNMTVIREATGKPVKNAEVVVHLVDKKGREKQEGLELKTHDDGKAEASGIPYGKVRIQVIAPGLKTYGEDFNIDQPNVELTIKMQKPAGQVSIYK